MARRIAVVVAIVAAVLCSTAVALAGTGGAGTQTFTQQSRDVLLFSQPGMHDPCNPSNTGTLTATANTEVFHATAQADGTFWVTGTAEGTVTFTPDNPKNVAASGHFASWFGESFNDKNDVQHDTNTFVLTGADGSHFVMHMVDHLSTNALGVTTVSFSVQNATASCG